MYRLVKCIASMKISAAVSSTPSVTPAAKAAEWTTGWRPSDCSSGEEDVAEAWQSPPYQNSMPPWGSLMRFLLLDRSVP